MKNSNHANFNFNTIKPFQVITCKGRYLEKKVYSGLKTCLINCIKFHLSTASFHFLNSLL